MSISKIDSRHGVLKVKDETAEGEVTRIAGSTCSFCPVCSGNGSRRRSTESVPQQVVNDIETAVELALQLHEEDAGKFKDGVQKKRYGGRRDSTCKEKKSVKDGGSRVAERDKSRYLEDSEAITEEVESAENGERRDVETGDSSSSGPEEQEQEKGEVVVEILSKADDVLSKIKKDAKRIICSYDKDIGSLKNEMEEIKNRIDSLESRLVRSPQFEERDEHHTNVSGIHRRRSTSIRSETHFPRSEGGLQDTGHLRETRLVVPETPRYYEIESEINTIDAAYPRLFRANDDVIVHLPLPDRRELRPTYLRGRNKVLNRARSRGDRTDEHQSYRSTVWKDNEVIVRIQPGGPGVTNISFERGANK